MLSRRRLLSGITLALVSIALTPEAGGTVLKNLADEQVVQKISYCKGEYTLTTANGERHRYPEFNLRFKTDASRSGPERGKPALLPAGMRGDRAFVIFSGLDDLKRFLVEQC